MRAHSLYHICGESRRPGTDYADGGATGFASGGNAPPQVTKAKPLCTLATPSSADTEGT
jgi:hypothetical protein